MDKKLVETSYAWYHSPLGWISVAATETYVTEVVFHDNIEVAPEAPEVMLPLQLGCIEQLIQYFQGERREFDLPLRQPGTSFQEGVWNLLTAIPFGKTISYLQLAIQTGDAKATRAVANANGRNNIAVIVPCHRVIGSNGELTGYAAGLWRKRWLLEHEQKQALGVQTLF